jgi:hypothetical protein
LLYKSGKPQQAAPYIQRALALDPQMAAARQLSAVMSGETRPVAQRTPATMTIARAAAPRTQQLPRVPADEGTWGDAPRPDSLPQLLPPVN